MLSDETGNEDAHSDRPIAAAPDHPTLPAAAPLPGTLPARPLPASEATSGSPSPRHDRAATAPDRSRHRADAPQAAATGHRRSHPRARAHRRHRHRADRRQPRPSRARSPNDGIGRRHELSADPNDHPARRYRRRPTTRPGQAQDQPAAASREATSPFGRRLGAGDGRRDPCVRRDIPFAGLELHGGQRRPLATPAQRAPANKRRQRRAHPPTVVEHKQQLDPAVKSRAEVARHRSRYMQLPLTPPTSSVLRKVGDT